MTVETYYCYKLDCIREEHSFQNLMKEERRISRHKGNILLELMDKLRLLGSSW